jgi:hypothetical protein
LISSFPAHPVGGLFRKNELRPIEGEVEEIFQVSEKKGGAFVRTALLAKQMVRNSSVNPTPETELM